MRIILFLLLFIGRFAAPLPAQTGPLEIWQIQGDAALSPYAGQQVITAAGVITAIGDDFFFMQSPAAQTDGDPRTSDGIFVATTQAGNRRIGDLVQVRGQVLEIDNQTQIGQGSVVITLLETNASLPAAVTLNRDFPSGVPFPVPELEAVEGMRVQLTGISCGPSDFRSMVPLVARSERPFREPGIQFPGLPDLPVWDGNPEIFWMSPNALGQPNNRFIAAGTPVEAEGVFFQSGREYVLFPRTYQLGTAPAPRAVRPAAAGEITLASFNARRFQLSEDNFDQRARKAARYIIEMLRSPDLIALQEIGSFSALSTLRFYIQQLDPSLEYNPFFLAGNDDIHLAFLAREGAFREASIQQLGKDRILPGGGLVFDRPPLLFSAQPVTVGASARLQVLNLHLRSLLGIEGSNERFVREKRYEQSLAVAEMVGDLRGENLFVVGDFNAFPFSDGYVDIVNQISGHPSQGAQYPVQEIVSPPLQKLSGLLSPEERYSYVFRGSAQLIDHALAGELQGLELVEMAFARANADFPEAYAPNEQLVESSSDHDGLVVYLKPALSTAADREDASPGLQIYPNPVRAGQPLYLRPPAGWNGELTITGPNGQVLERRPKQIGEPLVELSFERPGIYFLNLYTRRSFRGEKIIVLPAR